VGLAVIALESECRRLFAFQIRHQFSLSKKLDFCVSVTGKML
jgi:hypothetical protein